MGGMGVGTGQCALRLRTEPGAWQLGQWGPNRNMPQPLPPGHANAQKEG